MMEKWGDMRTIGGAALDWVSRYYEGLRERPLVSIGGGARGVNLHVAPADLFAATTADVVDITQPEPG